MTYTQAEVLTTPVVYDTITIASSFNLIKHLSPIFFKKFVSPIIDIPLKIYILFLFIHILTVKLFCTCQHCAKVHI